MLMAMGAQVASLEVVTSIGGDGVVGVAPAARVTSRPISRPSAVRNCSDRRMYTGGMQHASAGPLHARCRMPAPVQRRSTQQRWHGVLN